MVCGIFHSVEAQFDELHDYSGCIAADLPSELFNNVGLYIYTKDAEDALEELGTFNCLGVLQRYEQGEFGTVHTNLANPCEVADALFYIIGYEVFYRIFGDTSVCDELWNKRLTADDLCSMGDTARRWFETHPDWVEDVWKDL
jgi:hypothetical protein